MHNSDQYLFSNPPPSYSPYARDGQGVFRDPRASSSQSLVPEYYEHDGADERRRLLIIYVHGYRGTETSFRSLPAHVHKLLSISIIDSHVIHTKIYPRYYTKGDLKALAEDFSRWLSPHESPTTDIVLCGHSLGGVLIAEVALLRPNPGANTSNLLRHRLLGTVSFEAPFLGLHPAVVKSGLKSLFGKYEEPEPAANVPAQEDALASMVVDPNFNPAYKNDSRLPQPRDLFKDILHFVGKNTNDIIHESKAAIRTHWQYQRTIVTDIQGMRDRYTKIRALEEEDERDRSVAVNGRFPVPRVRFVNYYNACTSPERKKSPSQSRAVSPDRSGSTSMHSNERGRPRSRGRSAQAEDTKQDTTPIGILPSPEPTPMQAISPRIFLEEHLDDKVIQKQPENAEKLPQDDESSSTSNASVGSQIMEAPPFDPNLPPIPPIPEEPPYVDPSQYPEKDRLKLAQKEYARALKAYKQAVKDRNSAIKDRQKYEEKRRKSAKKEGKLKQKATLKASDAEKSEAKSVEELAAAQTSLSASSMASQSSIAPSDTEDEDAPTIAPSDNGNVYGSHSFTSRSENRALYNHASPSPSASQSTQLPTRSTANLSPSAQVPKKIKTKKFCILPSKVNGQPDQAWIRILMENTNPPAAHSDIFVPTTKTYEQLIGDVASRIEGWVLDDLSTRYVEMLSGKN